MRSLSQIELLNIDAERKEQKWKAQKRLTELGLATRPLRITYLRNILDTFDLLSDLNNEDYLGLSYAREHISETLDRLDRP